MNTEADIYRTIIRSLYGMLSINLYDVREGGHCLVISTGNKALPDEPIIRIHSSCLFGEILHSELCECQYQLQAALRLISEQGGLLIYLFQEGRGTGLANKIRAMEVERLEHLGTDEAFRHLGFAPDPRKYDLAIAAMKCFRVPRRIRFISNNPCKIAAIEEAGFSISERIEPELVVTAPLAQAMLRKQASLGHILYSHLSIVETYK